ncbi:glycosyltransferase family 2 protein [Candidatus Pacearchaeota archaeon]|nr:glycosyltransferase family 2 protein [Candidatus Pacearchaeota archaeon]
MDKPLLSVIVPMYNEEGNAQKLFEEIKTSLLKMIKQGTLGDYEIIFVNDGSRDGTQDVLDQIKKKEKNKFHFINFRKNFGQTPALKAGFSLVRGDFIITMDGDLQNDPADIPRLYDKLLEGFDVVSGWRFNRKDALGKKFSSRLMNALRKRMLKDDLHDYGCSLKIYRKECIKDLQLFGESHRYITAYLSIKGYKIGEIKVNHRPRLSGRTKYGFGRAINGVLDLFYLKFWSTFSDRPLHFFGRLGIYQWILAVFIGIEQIIKALIVRELTFGPLLALGSMLVITGLLFIIFGFLSEMISRSYFKNETVYSIKSIQ